MDERKGDSLRSSGRAGMLFAVAVLAGAAIATPPRRDSPPTQPATAPATRPASGPWRYGAPRQLADLADRRIDESSGIAPSRRRDDVFWTHNDSGPPRLYAFNTKGEDLGTFEVRGARLVDWEDLASCVLDGRELLVIGDVGDNLRRRKSVTVYLCPEPVLTPPPQKTTSVAVSMRIEFTYPDGPQDCEALAVDPGARTIYLLAKRGERHVYALPIPRLRPARPLVAERIATLRLLWVTGMDMSADPPPAGRAVVLTYGSAYEYVRGPGQGWAEAFAGRPRTLEMPPRRQGEAVCYDRHGRSLYLTSEGTPCPLYVVPAVGPLAPPGEP